MEMEADEAGFPLQGEVTCFTFLIVSLCQHFYVQKRLWYALVKESACKQLEAIDPTCAGVIRVLTAWEPLS